MPLITTLIPAYKKDFLGELFLGLRSQTLKDFRVVLSDDSPDAEITRLLAEGAWAAQIGPLDVQVVRGPRSARLNHQHLLDLWAGTTPLVHLHLDDDVIYPDFYRAHVAAHARQPLAASVSRRWLSGEDGRPAVDLAVPAFALESEQRVVLLSPAQLFGTTVAVCENWLGELSNMVLSAQGARRYPVPPAKGLNYYGLLDVGTLLEAAADAPVAWLPDHLGVFRQHPGQTTHNIHSHGGRVAFLAWVAYALAAWQQQRIGAPQAAQAIEIATARVVQHFGEADAVMNAYFELLEHHSGGLDLLHERFGAWWRRLLASHPSTDPQAYAARAEAVTA